MKRTKKRLSLGRETLRHLSETRLRQINGHGAGTDGCSDVYCNTYTEAAGSCLTCYTHCAQAGCHTIGTNLKTQNIC